MFYIFFIPDLSKFNTNIIIKDIITGLKTLNQEPLPNIIFIAPSSNVKNIPIVSIKLPKLLLFFFLFAI
jgi:hypothetical protein